MTKFFKGFRYAFAGIAHAIKGQLNIKIHLLVAALVTALGFYFRVTSTEWCVLILTITLVLSLELVNTAIENLVDLVSPNQHSLAGKIKDIAAGAVLIAAMSAAIIGIIIFYKYVYPSIE